MVGIWGTKATPDGLSDLILMILLMLGTDTSCQDLMQNVNDFGRYDLNKDDTPFDTNI